MSEEKLQIDFCQDSGCGIIVANVGEKQFNISLMPDEVLAAKKVAANNLTELKEILLDVSPTFINAIEKFGIEEIAKAIDAKKLPPILKKMAE